MPRVLIVGCGCRGRELASALVAEGHVVRGTTRSPGAMEAICATGAEPYLGDPDRIVTLMDALSAVTVAVWLLGTVEAPHLHAGRLRMFCEKTVDTPVRGIVYEASVVSPGGIAEVEMAGDTWQIPIRVVEAGAPLAVLLNAVRELAT